MTAPRRAVLIGVGQPLRSDDAVGRIIAQRLRQQAPVLPGASVEIHESDGDGAALMELWSRAETAILFDAVRAGRPVGTIHRFEGHRQPLPAACFAHSTHHWGLAEAVEMSRVLGQLPGTLVVYGIEGASFAMGDALSDPVEAAVAPVIARALDELTALLGG